MFYGDIVEPTDNLYKEGNIINKHTYKRKAKQANSERKGKTDKEADKDKSKEGTKKDDLGSVVDFEV